MRDYSVVKVLEMELEILNKRISECEGYISQNEIRTEQFKSDVENMKRSTSDLLAAIEKLNGE